MDKNTITGLVLIGILLVGFSFLSRPSDNGHTPFGDIFYRDRKSVV